MIAPAAHAGGLFVPGLGPQAMGRAGAFTAKADDPSALFHNPAGFTKLVGTVVQLGSNLLDYSLGFTREGVYEDSPEGGLAYAGQPYEPVDNQARPSVGLGPMQAVPLIAMGSDLGRSVPGLHVGLGVMAPNAYPGRSLGADYLFEDPNAPPPASRYDIVEQEAATVLPSLALAYAVGDVLSVGVRLSWGFADIKASNYTWALPNYADWVAADGLFTLEARDNFVPGFGAGVLYRPIDRVELGVSYSSALHVAATGTGTTVLGSYAADPTNGGVEDRIIPEQLWDCAQGGTPEALSMCLFLDLPQTASAGARYIIATHPRHGELADIELDVKWEDWSSASDYRVRVNGMSEQTAKIINESVIRHGFQDVLSVRLGGNYNVVLSDTARVGVRAGVAYDTAAAPNEWQRLDVDGAARTTVALGAAYQGRRFRVDVAGGMVLEGDRTVPGCNPANEDDPCPEGTAALSPLQPLFRDDQRQHSPVNGGVYSSGYTMLSLGLTTWF